MSAVTLDFVFGLAFRTAAAHQPREIRHRPRGRRGDPLAQPREQPLLRAGMGHRGGADPKPLTRTAGIMTGLLTALRYDTVVCTTAPALGQRRLAGLGWPSNQIV